MTGVPLDTVSRLTKINSASAVSEIAKDVAAFTTALAQRHIRHRGTNHAPLSDPGMVTFNLTPEALVFVSSTTKVYSIIDA